MKVIKRKELHVRQESGIVYEPVRETSGVLKHTTFEEVKIPPQHEPAISEQEKNIRQRLIHPSKFRVVVKENDDTPIYEVIPEHCVTSPENLRFETDDICILLLGQTGDGKSTLINSLFNFAMGAKYDDKYRFQLIEQRASKDQIHSQTTETSIYCFLWKKRRVFIIDSPGFGDTKSIEQDNRNAENIGRFLQAFPGCLHAIGLAIKSSDSRLTPTMRFVLTKIFSFFGNDAAKNFVPLCTFADDKEPLALEAIKSETQFEKYFAFNNSALYTPTTKRTMLTPFFYQMCLQGAEDFLEHCENLEPVGLHLTKKVIDHRQRCQLCAVKMQTDIKYLVEQIKELKKVEVQIRSNSSKIREGKNFTIESKVLTPTSTPTREITTNCLNCLETCHEGCGILEDSGKAGCIAMVNGYCRRCESKCHWSDHVNRPLIYGKEWKTQKQTLVELKKVYDEGQEGMTEVTRILLGISKSVEVQKRELIQTIENFKTLKDELMRIALKRSNQGVCEYIKVLMEKEENGDNDQGTLRVLEDLYAKHRLIEEDSQTEVEVVLSEVEEEMAKIEAAMSPHNSSLSQKIKKLGKSMVSWFKKRTDSPREI
mmetsp:Transcript_32912/g.37335  ORF Transcript_32912/g.37335 Transcript_32912/m.37335 type:complete len:596 (-) Transcript_32912:587-2374(-)